ncbi:hypothetical protein V3C99_016926 [Haemonchus contortus]|uniref:PBPe domain-containing protein n=2 Tax=Haemonchus contortus TaxID=6289 RepID=A0A7I4YZQ0_HAECO
MALTKNSTFKAFALLLIKVAVILYGATIIFWISTEYYYRSFIKICEERNKSTEVSSNDDYHYYEKDLLKAVQHYGQLLGVRFPRNARTSHIDCGRLLHEDKQSGHVKGLASSRVELSDQNRSMSCEDIRARVLPPKPLQTLQFGVAHARIVYESYELIEEELRSSYHPQNVFCYAIDYKAKEDFTQKIEKLSKCLPNVLVPTTRYSIGRTGINGTRAHYECLKALMGYTGWEYVMLMQNYDIMIKSVYETVSILQKLGGANDVHVRPCESYRYNSSMKWDVQSLKFFRNEKDMKPTQRNASLTFARGAAHATLSRAAVNWMVNTVDLTKTFEQLDLNVLGVDEVLIPTLQVSDSLDMPGRFTAECVQKGKVIGFITRVETWSYDNSPECRSKHYRHSVCVYGIEDFAWLTKYPKLMANKMMPSFDYGAVDCMHELLFNRTYLGQVDQVWNLTIYETQPYVQYHKYRKNPHSGFQLDCSFGI